MAEPYNTTYSGTEVDKSVASAHSHSNKTTLDKITESSGNLLFNGASLKGADGKDGKNGTDGAPGKDGITPHIGANGNWFIGTMDTGVLADADNFEFGAF
jgi:hypothetical protein